MSSSAPLDLGPTLPEVINVLEGMIPPGLAGSWDNVGLLIDRPAAAGPIERILLTNDLTDDVLADAIHKRVSLIISYHPTPFRGLKRITASSREGRVVMGCLVNGIAVYSPHTAADAVPGGVCDWLVGGVAGGLGDGVSLESSAPIQPDEKMDGAGAGRIMALNKAVPLRALVDCVKAFLGIPHLRLGLSKEFLSVGSNGASGDMSAGGGEGSGVAGAAAAVRTAEGRRTKALDTCMVKTIALCPGSGVSVLDGAKADVYLTGEMSHHEVIGCSAAGITVILTEHSNCERGYLRGLRDRFDDELGKLVAAAAPAAEGKGGGVERELVRPMVLVSDLDADPLAVV